VGGANSGGHTHWGKHLDPAASASVRAPTTKPPPGVVSTLRYRPSALANICWGVGTNAVAREAQAGKAWAGQEG
jgi:hypothetical protein